MYVFLNHDPWTSRAFAINGNCARRRTELVLKGFLYLRYLYCFYKAASFYYPEYPSMHRTTTRNRGCDILYNTFARLKRRPHLIPAYDNLYRKQIQTSNQAFL